MTSWTLTASPLARLFNRGVTVTIDQSGIHVLNGGNSVEFSWSQLDSPPRLSLALSGGCLTLVCAGQTYRYRMLSYRAPIQYSKQFFPLWANQNAQHLQDFFTSAYIQCTESFIRDSAIERLQSFAQSELERWKGWNNVQGLSALAEETVSKLSNIANWSATDIDKIRNRYVRKQLALYQEFFDSVEWRC